MCTEIANAQESVVAAIKNLATTSSRGGLGERPPKIPMSSASPRGRNREHKKILFFFFPAVSIPTARTELVAGAIKKSATRSSRGGLGERLPQILTSPASPQGRNRAHKKILFFFLPCSSDFYSPAPVQLRGQSATSRVTVQTALCSFGDRLQASESLRTLPSAAPGTKIKYQN
jgi:hypothetical protein